jgi:hypothetical protein
MRPILAGFSGDGNQRDPSVTGRGHERQGRFHPFGAFQV